MPAPSLPKRLLLTLAAAFLAYQSYGLWAFAKTVPTFSPAAQVAYALALGLFVTGVFAFAGFAWPTHRLLPDGYYAIGRPARLRRVYRALGVEHFRRFLLATFWRSDAQRAKYFTGTRAGLGRLATMSRKSEFGHLAPLVALAVAAGVLIARGAGWAAAALTLANLLGNGYPILLQRDHRRRLTVLRRRYGLVGVRMAAPAGPGRW